MKNSTTQRTAQLSGREKSRTITLSAATLDAAEKTARRLNITARDVIGAAVKSASNHVREHRSLPVPFRILQENCIPVLIDGELRKSLESAADKNGTGLSWLVRLLAEHGLKQLSRGNFRIVHPGDEKGLLSTQTPAPPPDPPARPAQELPKLRTTHAKKLLVIAELLDVRPQDLLDWNIGGDIHGWYKGDLRHYAESFLDYPNDEERAKVMARLDAWEARRRLARRKPSMGSGVEA